MWEWEDTNPIIHNELIMQYHRIITSPYESSDPVNIEQVSIGVLLLVF